MMHDRLDTIDADPCVLGPVDRRRDLLRHIEAKSGNLCHGWEFHPATANISGQAIHRRPVLICQMKNVTMTCGTETDNVKPDNVPV
jgi:hypothetical protein